MCFETGKKVWVYMVLGKIIYRFNDFKKYM